MFKWIKNILKSEPPVRKEEVKLSILEEWFETRMYRAFESLKPQIAELLSRIEQERDTIRHNMDVLAKSRLLNANLPPRAIQIMEGNRNAFIEKTRFFVDGISIPKEISFSSMDDFCVKLEADVNSIAESNAKGYAVMQEFFANESLAVVKNIKAIDDAAKAIKALIVSRNLGKAEEIQKDIESISGFEEIQREHSHNIQAYSSQLAETEKKIEEISQNIEILRKGKEYEKLQEKLSRKDYIESQIRSSKEDIVNMFAPIQKAMKKYEHICVENTDVLKRYNDNTAEGFENDPEFRITDILQSMKSHVEELGLKDKQKQKSISLIDGITKDALHTARKELDVLKNSLVEVKREALNMSINRIIDDQTYKLEHVKDKQKRMMMEIEKSKKILSKIDVEELKAKIVEGVKESFNIELSIIQG